MKVIRIMLLCAFMVGTAGVTCSDLGVMSVQVKEAQLRETPSFLGAIVAPVGYGDRVNVLEQKGDWANVKDCRSNQGWLHQSALTKKQVVLGVGGQAPQAASGQEIALAGKGFNADVESRYRSAHRQADYASVNRMESMRVTREEMVQFLTEGNVKPTEGGAR